MIISCSIVTDQNGKIDKREMRLMIKAIYKIIGVRIRIGPNSPKRRAELIFKTFDTANKGYLTEDEFIDAWQTSPVFAHLLRPVGPEDFERFRQASASAPNL